MYGLLLFLRTHTPLLSPLLSGDAKFNLRRPLLFIFLQKKRTSLLSKATANCLNKLCTSDPGRKVFSPSYKIQKYRTRKKAGQQLESRDLETWKKKKKMGIWRREWRKPMSPLPKPDPGRESGSTAAVEPPLFFFLSFGHEMTHGRNKHFGDWEAGHCP